MTLLALAGKKPLDSYSFLNHQEGKITSGGEPKAISAAHQTFTWALLGIVIMAVTWVIMLLIKAFTGIDVTTFNVNVLK